MKTNVNATTRVQEALDDAQSALRAGRLNAADIARGAIYAEADLAEARIPKHKRSGAIYRLYARDGAATYAILTRGPGAAARWFLTEVGRVTGVHGPSRVYTGIDRDEIALFDALGITPNEFVDALSVGTAHIAANGVSVGVRGGIGGSAWVAEIVGTDARYGLERAFVQRESRDLSRSENTGSVGWGALADGIYEAGGFCTAYGDGVHTMSVYFIVRGDLVASLGQRRASILKAVA